MAASNSLVKYVTITCLWPTGYEAVISENAVEEDSVLGCGEGIFELGVDALPDGVVDIRSQLDDPPDRVFVACADPDSDEREYFGFCQMAV